MLVIDNVELNKQIVSVNETLSISVSVTEVLAKWADVDNKLTWQDVDNKLTWQDLELKIF